MERIVQCPPLPSRASDGHKGTFGRVLVVGGSVGMIGAPVLSGTAALRTGSGLVQVAVPRTILSACLSITPELIGLPLAASSDHRSLRDAAKKADVVAVGPGMGTARPAAERLAMLIALSGKALVLDADALNLLAARARWPADFHAAAVLTPHPGEMARLVKFIGRREVPDDDDGRLQIAAALATQTGQIVVLKGARTVVTDGRRAYVNRTGDSSLAKAGSGDVLTGMLASLIGQGMERFEAAVAAVHLHGLAGEIAGRSLGQRSVLARDVIDAIGSAIARFQATSRSGR